jgi:thiosulfate/3-mercaptopyruvate sulfurtransferase
VSTGWLSERLGEQDIRVLDATAVVKNDGDGRFGAVNGREAFDEAHIPGAQFVDVMQDLADPDSPLRFMVPTPERFIAAMEARGVGDGTRVIVYSGGATFWATRVWWLLNVFGFSNVGVLDGGFTRWRAEGRPTSNGSTSPRPARFTARFRPELIADKAEVLRSVRGERGAACLVDALPANYFAGQAGDSYGYGRLGHIKGAVNVPSERLQEAGSGLFLRDAALRTALTPALEQRRERIVTYCGGGIAATQAAFGLTLLGHENVAVYDASLQEWVKDDSLPMEI